ncbi:MAG: hypothetical protein V1731_03095 [Candidatus Aenigmatarchaeota archaeon]
MKRTLAAVFLALIAMAVSATSLGWSATKEFNVTNALYVNWTNADGMGLYAINISIGNNATYDIVVNITNSTKLINNSFSITANFSVRNVTGWSEQVSVPGMGTQNVSLIFNYTGLRAGRYVGTFIIANASTASEYASVNVTLDISLTLNETTMDYESFFGRLSSPDPYERYFFNASSGDSINIQISTTPLYLFLFDQSGIVDMNVSNTTQYQNRSISFLTRGYNQYYELRVYNASIRDFNGFIRLGTLNTSRRFLDFGSVNTTSATGHSNTTTYDLNNTKPINLEMVRESWQMYLNKRYTNLVNASNFTVLVSKNYQKLEAVVEWRNATADFNMTIYNSSFQPISGYAKRNLSNVPGVAKSHVVVEKQFDEFNKTWIVSVVGTHGVEYNVTIKSFIDASWINSSFGNYLGYYVINETQNSSTVSLNMTPPAWLIDGLYNGSISYGYSEAKTEIPFGINVTGPMLVVNNTLDILNFAVTDNLGANKTVNFGFLINNTGSYDLYLGDYNTTSLNFSDHSIWFNYSFQNPVPAGSSSMLNVRFNLTTLSFNSDESVYLGWILLNSTNAHPYNAFRINMTFNLTNKLNFFVYNVSNYTGSNWIRLQSTTNNSYINVTVNITFQNGSFVPNLNPSNFSVWMQNTFVYEGSNYTYNVTDMNVTAVHTNAGVYKYYVLNVSVPSSAFGGNFTVYASARDAPGGFANYGADKFSYLYVNKSLMTIDLTNGTSDAPTFYATGDYDVNMTVFNQGAEPATDVNVSGAASGSCSIKTGYMEGFYIGNISSYSSYSNSTIWKLSIVGNGTCTFAVVGNSPRGAWLLNDTIDFGYVGGYPAPPSGSSSGTGGSGESAMKLEIFTNKASYLRFEAAVITFNITSTGAAVSGATISYNITDSSDNNLVSSACLTGSDGKCVVTHNLTSATTGEYRVVARASKTGFSSYSATKSFRFFMTSAQITYYSSYVSVLQGSKNTTEVNVKNNGSLPVVLRLKITNITESWIKTTPSQITVAQDVTSTFIVEITAPLNATIGKYYAIIGVQNDSYFDTRSALVLVFPTDATKEQISRFIADYLSVLNSVSERLNSSKLLFQNNSNIITAESMANTAFLEYREAVSALASGNYIKANEKITEAKRLADLAQSLIAQTEKAGEKFSFDLVLIVGAIIVLVGGVGALAYMLMPPPGYSPSAGYVHAVQNADAFAKIKDEISKLIGKVLEFFKKITTKKQEDYVRW